MASIVFRSLYFLPSVPLTGGQMKRTWPPSLPLTWPNVHTVFILHVSFHSAVHSLVNLYSYWMDTCTLTLSASPHTNALHTSLFLSFFLSFFLSLSLSLSLSFSLIVAIPGYHWHCHCSCTSSTSSSLSSGSKVHYILVSLASCSGLLLEKVPLYQLKVDAVEVSH